MALSEVVKQFLASRRPLPSSLERDVEALPAAQVPERLGEGATTMPMQDLGTTPALSDNDPRRDRGYNTDRSSMTAPVAPPEAPGTTRQASRVSAPQGPASTPPRAQEFVPEPVYPEAMTRMSFSSRPEAQARGEGDPNADLRRAFVTEYPDDLGDAALKEAQERDRRAVAMADARDGFRHATSLITGTPQQAKVNPNAVAVEEFLRRRGLAKENAEGEQKMALWLLNEQAKAKAEGRQFDLEKEMAKFKAGLDLEGKREGWKVTSEENRLDRESEERRARISASTRAGHGMGRGAYRIVRGPGGQQFAVNTADPSDVVPLTSDGNPLLADKNIPANEKGVLQDLAQEKRALSDLQGEFKEDFAGKGLVGGAKTFLSQALGSWGTKGMQENAAFWADFSRLIDIPQRHRLFGASLTANEKQSWEAAKNIRPGSDPELVRRKMEEMQAILDRKLTEHGEALLSEGYNADAVGALTGTKLKRVSTVAEAMALPPGTRFVDPDGVERVR